MSDVSDGQCDRIDRISLYALGALPAKAMRVTEAHIAGCPECRQELESLRPIVDSLTFWPTEVLRPSDTLWERLARRIAAGTGAEPLLRVSQQWSEPEWEEVAPGISCKLLATDSENDRVSMLVRLSPGVDYPPHTHAGVEELHLLHGDLWINDRKLHPGDYNRSERGTADQRVWSESGCTCVLITSAADSLS